MSCSWNALSPASFAPPDFFVSAIAVSRIVVPARSVVHSHADAILALREMSRVAPEGGYVQVDSYRTPEERETFLKWVLTARTHYDTEGWKRLFAEAGYQGDYYWTIME